MSLKKDDYLDLLASIILLPVAIILSIILSPIFIFIWSNERLKKRAQKKR